MSVVDKTAAPRLTVVSEQARATYDARSLQLLDARDKKWRRRGWLVRRALGIADVVALTVAFGIAEILFPHVRGVDRADLWVEWVFFLASLPVWIIVASFTGLYARDGERTDHSTADDLIGVFNVVTVGTWLVFTTAWVTSVIVPQPKKLVTFWALFKFIAFCERV